MSFIVSIFKSKKIIFVLFFLFSLFSMSKSNPRKKIIDNKCDYGKEYIKGKCIKPTFDMIPEEKIDEDGVYKYIQIRCDKKYLFVRRKDCKYHKNIFSKFLDEVDSYHLDKNLCKALGGGRIITSKKKKTIKIYGYSKRFGRVKNQHEITKQILQKYYHDYDITWSNEGY